MVLAPNLSPPLPQTHPWAHGFDPALCLQAALSAEPWQSFASGGAGEAGKARGDGGGPPPPNDFAAAHFVRVPFLGPHDLAGSQAAATASEPKAAGGGGAHDCGDSGPRPSERKSGSDFATSGDGQYIIKSLPPDETSVLLRLLESYTEHAVSHAGTTLLPRFLAIVRVRLLVHTTFTATGGGSSSSSFSSSADLGSSSSSFGRPRRSSWSACRGRWCCARCSTSRAPSTHDSSTPDRTPPEVAAPTATRCSKKGWACGAPSRRRCGRRCQEAAARPWWSDGPPWRPLPSPRQRSRPTAVARAFGTLAARPGPMATARLCPMGSPRRRPAAPRAASGAQGPQLLPPPRLAGRPPPEKPPEQAIVVPRPIVGVGGVNASVAVGRRGRRRRQLARRRRKRRRRSCDAGAPVRVRGGGVRAQGPVALQLHGPPPAGKAGLKPGLQPLRLEAAGGNGGWAARGGRQLPQGGRRGRRPAAKLRGGVLQPRGPGAGCRVLRLGEERRAVLLANVRKTRRGSGRTV